MSAAEAKSQTPDDVVDHTDVLSKKRMLAEMAELKEFEAHDRKGDLFITDPHPGGDGNGYDVSSSILHLIKSRVEALPQEEFSLKPPIQFGFTEDEIFVNFLRWSQKDEDVEANRFNIDKTMRRLTDFGKFMVEYAKELEAPLSEEQSVHLLQMVGLQGDGKTFAKDGFGRIVSVSNMVHATTSDAAQAHFARLEAEGTLVGQFVRAYTWWCFTVMKHPESCRQGMTILVNYGFIGVGAAQKLQNIFSGKKLKKALGKLFHGTCPIKIKSIVCINCPWWMRMMIAFARLFVSGKIMGRMHVMGSKHAKLAGYFGGAEYIPKEYFGEDK